RTFACGRRRKVTAGNSRVVDESGRCCEIRSSLANQSLRANEIALGCEEIRNRCSGGRRGKTRVADVTWGPERALHGNTTAWIFDNRALEAVVREIPGIR